jgi:hypothetical protein
VPQATVHADGYTCQRAMLADVRTCALSRDHADESEPPGVKGIEGRSGPTRVSSELDVRPEPPRFVANAGAVLLGRGERASARERGLRANVQDRPETGVVGSAHECP